MEQNVGLDRDADEIAPNDTVVSTYKRYLYYFGKHIFFQPEK